MDRKKIGRYEILDELGRGAMGSVLRARDPAMGRVVALKCILSAALAGEQMNEFRERFYREARAAGALAHPGIVPVFDVGEDDGVPFLVMELVQGRTLDAALKAGERCSLERVCEIGQQLADALGYAHRNGVIHRDIKPANILMTSREVYGAERPRITDFGVAKLTGGEATTTGQLLGTPAFMPPEQFTGAPIDGRTDLFALGVILYRMTTGEQPFPGETLTAVSYKVVHTEPIPPSKLNPAIPARLEALILKCLAKNPAQRYQTGEELAADLAAVLPGARTTGSYPAMTQAPAGETIDQVTSLRPKPVAATMAGTAAGTAATAMDSAAARSWAGRTQSGTVGPAAAAPVAPVAPPAPPAPSVWTPMPSASAAAAPPPAPAASPEEALRSYFRATQSGAAMPSAPPAPAPPPPAPAEPLQSHLRTALNGPAMRAAAVPAAAAPSAPPASPRTPMPAEPAPAPSTPRSAQSAPVMHTMPSTASMRTYAPAAHPDSTLRPAHASRAEATLTPRTGRPGQAEMPARQVAPKKRGMGLFAWLIFIAIAVGGTWLFLQMRPQQTASTSDAGQAVPAAGGVAAPVDFNPKTLDAKTNTRLSFDFDSLPSALTVTVLMDGKTYWSGTAGDHDSYSGLMAPPGPHSFRVVVSAGGAQKSSGSLSGNFSAGKHMTLTVKLWPAPSNGSFDPSSDVIVSLERNFF